MAKLTLDGVEIEAPLVEVSIEAETRGESVPPPGGTHAQIPSQPVEGPSSG